MSILRRRTFQTDYKLGQESEDQNLDAIKTLDSGLVKSSSKFAPFDYYSTTTYVELKTRTFEKNKYPTTMIGYNKVVTARNNTDKTYYFVFNFTDGLYYIQYNKEVFDTFEIKEGGRYDRGRPEVSLYCYIPIDRLSLIQSSTIMKPI